VLNGARASGASGDLHLIFEIHFVSIRYSTETTATILANPIAAFCLGENAAEYRKTKMMIGIVRNVTVPTNQIFCLGVRLLLSKYGYLR